MVVGCGVGAVIQDQEPREALVLMGRPPRNWSLPSPASLKIKISKHGVGGRGGRLRGGMPFVKVLHSLTQTHVHAPPNFKLREKLAGGSRSFSHCETKRRQIDCESLCGPTPREIRAHKALWDKHTTPHDPIPIRTLSTAIVFCVSECEISRFPQLSSSFQFATFLWSTSVLVKCLYLDYGLKIFRVKAKSWVLGAKTMGGSPNKNHFILGFNFK